MPKRQENWRNRRTLWGVVGFIAVSVVVAASFAVALWLNDTKGDGAGTAAEWFTGITTIFIGLLTAVFAYNAWRASQQAVRADRRAIYMMEQDRAGRVRLKFTLYDDDVHGWILRLAVPEGAPAIETVAVSRESLYLANEPEGFEDSLAKALGGFAGVTIMSGQQLESVLEAPSPFRHPSVDGLFIDVFYCFPEPMSEESDPDQSFHAYRRLQLEW